MPAVENLLLRLGERPLGLAGFLTAFELQRLLTREPEPEGLAACGFDDARRARVLALCAAILARRGLAGAGDGGTAGRRRPRAPRRHGGRRAPRAGSPRLPARARASGPRRLPICGRVSSRAPTRRAYARPWSSRSSSGISARSPAGPRSISSPARAARSRRPAGSCRSSCTTRASAGRCWRRRCGAPSSATASSPCVRSRAGSSVPADLLAAGRRGARERPGRGRPRVRGTRARRRAVPGGLSPSLAAPVPIPVLLAPAVRGEPSDLPNLVVDACHDLRTPLAAAFGFARTIERMGGVTGDNAMYLQQVIEATEELEQLIAALSAVAHGERGTLRLRPQQVDLGELTLEAAEGSGHAARARRRGRHDRDRPGARGHLARVARRAARRRAGRRRSAVWRIASPDTVTFGPLAGLDAELFERDLRAYAGRKVLGLLGATVDGRGRPPDRALPARYLSSRERRRSA